VFIESNSIVRKFSIAIAIALIGGVLAPLATATSASATTPANGRYTCTTGVRQAQEPIGYVPSYTITNGEVSEGGCEGALVLPPGVTSIGDNAFEGALTSITIPASVTSIGDFAFDNSDALVSITFAQGSQLRSIGDDAFRGTSALTSITIPSGVVSIGEYAFGASALTSITIPASVTSIGFGAFGVAYSLTSITVESGNQNFTSVDGVLFDKAATTLIQYPLGKSDPIYSVPAGVTSIGDQAFVSATSLTSITIPASVTVIGDEAFTDAESLASITFDQGSQLTNIGEYAFDGATALASITIPASVTDIGVGAFDYVDALASITVDSGNQSYTSVDGALFNKTATTLIRYPEGKGNLSYEIPEGVTSIGGGAFQNASSLTSINIPEGVTSIGDSAFQNASSLTSINIPEGVTSIGQFTFKNAYLLASINIPASVTSIGQQAFTNANFLTSITIPAGVASIGGKAFYSADLLHDVNFLGNAPASIGDNVFDAIATGAKVHRSYAATGFGTESTWNGLVVSINYTVTYNAANGTAVASGSFAEGGTIQTAPVSTRDGYTLTGWSTSANGSVVTFPYSPIAGSDLTLFAIWAQNPVKATYASGAKLTGKAKVGKSMTVASGLWNGTAPISYTYQWYSCKVANKRVLTTGNAAPKCSAIKKATKASFKLTTKQKGSYLAVKITGANRVGSSVIFTATAGKIS
jgi:uncharacterized repeat protein (TIGR02543 family)